MSLARAVPAAGPKRWQWAAVGCVVVASAASLAMAQALGRPVLAAVLALGLAAVPALVIRQRLMLAVLAVAEVANLDTIAGDHGVPKTYVALLALAGVGLVVHWWRDGHRLVWSSVLWFGAAFFATRVVSILAAADREAAVTSLVELGKGLVFLVVVVSVCVHTRGERLVAGAMVTTAALLCLLELVQQFLLHNRTTFFGLSQGGTVLDVGLAVGRHSGPLADHNFWGRVLVVVAPLALSLFADRSAPRRRWWWLGAFLLISAGVYLTGSRGSLLVLAAVVPVWCVLAGRRYRRLLLLVPVVAGLLLVVPGVGSRLFTVTDVSNTADSQADSSLTGRVAAQQVGAHMFLDHPAIGVGAGNFEVVEPGYQREYGIDGPVLAPHDLYLEMAAESGLLGLAGWLGLYACGLFVAVRARLLTRRRLPTDEPTADWMLAGGAIAGLLGWGLNGILLHLSTFPVFALLLAIVVTLDQRARRAAAAAEGAFRWRPDMLGRHVVRRADRPPLVRRVVPGVVLLAVVGLGLLVPGVLTQQWSASSALRIVTQTSGEPPEAYSLTVMSGQSLALTYLSLLGEEGFRRQADDTLRLSAAQRAGTTVTASASDTGGLLTVTAVGPQPEVARGLAEELPAEVMAYVNGLHPMYELREVPTAGAAPTPTTVLRPAALGVLLVVATALAAASWVALRARATRVSPAPARSPASSRSG